VRQVVYVPQVPLPASVFEAHGLRAGMWVQTPNGVGIVTTIIHQPKEQTPAIEAEWYARVMLTDAEGIDLADIYLAPSLVRQATLAEIPAPRRPDPQTAARLGYL
jgi:hypothetical protein